MSIKSINRTTKLIFRSSYKPYFLPTVKRKDWENCFYQTLKDDLRTYDNIWKIATAQRDDYTTICLLWYPYFKKYYRMIVIDLDKQQALEADPKRIQKINFNVS